MHACFHVVCVEFLTICICKESVTLSACADQASRYSFIMIMQGRDN